MTIINNFKKKFSLEDIFSLLLEREDRGERRGIKKHQCKSETSIGCLSNATGPRIVHAT